MFNHIYIATLSYKYLITIEGAASRIQSNLWSYGDHNHSYKELHVVWMMLGFFSSFSQNRCTETRRVQDERTVLN